MPSLADLCSVAVALAGEGEVEAYAEEATRSVIRAQGGEINTLTVAESRGIGIRVILDGRLGFAQAADPMPSAVPELVEKARQAANAADVDEGNRLPRLAAVPPVSGIYAGQNQLTIHDKTRLAIQLERAAVSAVPSVRAVESATYGDLVRRVAIMSSHGGPLEYVRSDCWAYVNCIAEAGDDRQTGAAYELARDPRDLAWERAAAEAAFRASRLLGGRMPTTRRLPVVLHPVAGAALLSIVAQALSADTVQKGRSSLSGAPGARLAAPGVTIADDGLLERGIGTRPFDDEGVASQRTTLIERGVLRGYLHNAATAAMAGTRSTGNAGRRSYRAVPGVACSNLHIAAGAVSPEELVQQVDDGVYVQELFGLHAGASAITGAFSVGATGLRISHGAIAEPLRGLTIASTLPDILGGVSGVASDLRFFPFGGAIGAPSILVDAMAVAGR
jgi:PmbA protein